MMKRLFVFHIALFALTSLAIGAQEQANPAGLAASGQSITPRAVQARIPIDIPLDAVKWTGGFWQDRLRRLRDIYLPGTIDGIFMDPANGSTLRNFLRAAGLEKGGALGRSWSDGDCLLLLDVASRLQAYAPDAYLKKKLDTWIPIIAKIQREDGLVDTWTRLKDFDAAAAKTWARFEHQNENRGHLTGGYQYILGHLYKAAVTHQRATGESSLLNIADRYLQHYVERAEQGGAPSRSYGISPQVAYACGLRYARTGEQRFLNAMGRAYGSQGTVFGPPLRDAVEIFGHNTQSAHTLIGAAMLYGFTGEPAILEALRRLSDNLLSSKVFITGAIAPVSSGPRPEQIVQGRKYKSEIMHEAVGAAYDLPNETAYCESCGQCLYMEFFYRMFLLTGEARYMDAVERSMVNAVPGCVDLDRAKFFYANPQEQLSSSKRRRESDPESGWSADHYTWRRIGARKCACCPPKVLRALALVNEMAYSVNGEGLWVNLYGNNTVKVALPEVGMLECRQTSGYPWDGKVRLVIDKPAGAKPFTIFLRVPGWVDSPVSITVNGERVKDSIKPGAYHGIRRQWKKSDTVEMSLPMTVRLMAAHPNVADDRGKVAVMRGPVAYCVEGDDLPADLAIERLRFPAATKLEPVFSSELGGVMKLTGSMVYSPTSADAANPLLQDAATPALYRAARFKERAKPLAAGDRLVTAGLIPYYARLNRKSDCFRIWLPGY